jgi:glycosyltransferase involved in cell wall biosynthesis
MSESIKILYVLASRQWGGGEQYVYDLVRNLPKDRFECYAVVPASQVDFRKMTEIASAGHVFSLPMRSLFDLGSARKLSAIICKREINIIHVNKFSDAFLAVWARWMSGRRVRIVMTRHLIRRGKRGPLYNYLYSRLDELIFVSELARREFLSRGAKIDPLKMRVVHNGIPDAPQNPAAKSADVVTLAFVGRVVEEKGLDTLLAALSDLGTLNFRLKIMGTGSDEYIDTLKCNASRDGLARKLSFVGFTDDVNAALGEAEIGVLPSIVREGFPISVLEYMRSGLAIVASDNGGQIESLTDGETALLTPPGDVKRLTEAIRTLITHPEQRRKMGEAARQEFLSHLTYSHFLGEMTKLYEGLCR